MKERPKAITKPGDLWLVGPHRLIWCQRSTAKDDQLRDGHTNAVLASIAFERERQKASEGWTEEHDDAHDAGEMGMAAACYAASERIFVRTDIAPDTFADAWPWDKAWDKRAKHDRRRQLVIAGALIVAELERILRQDERDAKRGQ